jgi:hypothetical protein
LRSLLKSINFVCLQRRLPKAILRRMSSSLNKTGRRNGPGRRSFPRKVTQSPKLLMASPTILPVLTILSNGSVTPLRNVARTPPTMEFQKLMARNVLSWHALLLLLSLLRKRLKDLMRILMVTERVAGEDYSLYCRLFSAGHSFILYKLSLNGFSLSGAWSSLKGWCTSKLWSGIFLHLLCSL